MRIFFALTIGFVLLLCSPALSAERQRYASIVVVEATGEVLHARHAEKLRHPASLAKVMTLYLLFDAIERGDIGMDDRLRVSTKAAKTKPSKLGLKANTTISVENAIRALVTKSANDVAVVIAERLSGGEAKFAGKMTRTAQVLGMRRTRFANSSGLPDKRQVSTAKDMAILAAAIRKDFPDMYRYFSLTKFVFNGKTYGNHNSLIGKVSGVDGLKTGYTNGAGYNVAVTAEREGVRIIAVVFGGATASQRDTHAKDLLEAAYKQLEKRGQLLATTTPISPVPDLQQMAVQAPAGLSKQIDQGSAAKRGVRIIIEGQEPVDADTKTPIKAANQWLIQVGAYSKRSQAEARLNAVSQLLLPTLKTASALVETSTRGDKILFRARFKGLKQQAAINACLILTNRGEPCFPLAAAN